MDDANLLKAENVYGTLCASLEKREWHYEKDDEQLTVRFGVGGEDIPMNFIIAVDAERQLIRLLSVLPFEIEESKRMEGTIVISIINFGLADGSFDYDLSDGRIFFRQTASFRNSEIGDGLFQYLISCACATVDEYNDKLMMFSKGMMSVSDFLKD